MPIPTDEVDFSREIEDVQPSQQTLSPRHSHKTSAEVIEQRRPFKQASASPVPQIPKAQQLSKQNPRQSHAERRTSLDSNDFIDDEDDPDLYNAIVASLLQPEAQKYGSINAKELDDEKRILKEVMQLSKLEDAKQQGKVNLDFLKRKNKAQQQQAPPEMKPDI